MKQVKDVMTSGVRTLSPNDTVVLAAQAMEELDIGSLPVCDGSRIVGMVTDRDIVLRVVAQDLAPKSTPLQNVMSTQVEWVFEDESLDNVTARMQQLQIRRLPVMDRENRLVGMLSLGDLASKGSPDQAGAALADISEPSRPTRSGQSAASGAAGGGETA
ncbi:CBS domain-containing protein [Hydrogenophaga sp.]|uniref:CBS domain-containing protein n=1 Tax=Hydrogenophaga sp. TaxID=1904254 RepID=UPI00272523FB|nr:CBS domain-containing protein [Hydrogenophaga sp.]MDO9438114.1 CBS domain-containing protein [Hydrogenophaga sp.]